MSKAIKVIAVDSGKYDTKAMTKVGDKIVRIKFRTKMDPTEEEYTSFRDTFVISLKGDNKRYIIGTGAEGVDYDKSKSKDIHKLAIYTAISRLVDSGDNVSLTIGCPLSVFNNVEERKAYKKFMLGTGDIEIIINGDLFTFKLINLNVCPESSGIIWSDLGTYSKKLVGIIDIGGLNTNASIYDKGNPVKSTSFTNNKGSNIMRNELKNELNQRFVDCNIQDWQMEDIIENGFIKSNPEESRKLISSFLAIHINGILDDCKKKGWDLKNIDVIFVGGGSKLLKREILSNIPTADISENAEWDNVDGFWAMGKAVIK